MFFTPQEVPSNNNDDSPSIQGCVPDQQLLARYRSHLDFNNKTINNKQSNKINTSTKSSQRQKRDTTVETMDVKRKIVLDFCKISCKYSLH